MTKAAYSIPEEYLDKAIRPWIYSDSNEWWWERWRESYSEFQEILKMRKQIIEEFRNG